MKKRLPVQAFSCEYCEIVKNSFFVEHLQCLLLMSQTLTFQQVLCFFFFFNIITSTIFKIFLRNYVSVCSKIVMALKGQMHIKVSDQLHITKRQTHSGLFQTSMMEYFEKQLTIKKPINIFARCSIRDVQDQILHTPSKGVRNSLV